MSLCLIFKHSDTNRDTQKKIQNQSKIRDRALFRLAWIRPWSLSSSFDYCWWHEGECVSWRRIAWGAKLPYHKTVWSRHQLCSGSYSRLSSERPASKQNARLILTSITNVHQELVQESMLADDCMLVAHTEEDLQALTNLFSNAITRCGGLVIRIEEREVLYHPPPPSQRVNRVTHINSNVLRSAQAFNLLGRILSSSATIDDEITHRVSRASASFGRCSLTRVFDVTMASDCWPRSKSTRPLSYTYCCMGLKHRQRITAISGILNSSIRGS